MDLLFTILLITTSALMILLVLLHKGRGGGLSDMFGGGVSSSLGRLVRRRAQPRPAHRRHRRDLVRLRHRPGPAAGLPGLRKDADMAGGGNAIRGSRVGAGPMGEAERGEAAPRQAVTYFCSHGHRSVVTFAVEAAVPDSWDCPKCGLPASVDSDNPPPAPKIEPYKTHLAYVKERRSDAEAADHPRRGPRAAALPPQVRRHHLLTLAARGSACRSHRLTGDSCASAPNFAGEAQRFLQELRPGALWMSQRRPRRNRHDRAMPSEWPPRRSATRVDPPAQGAPRARDERPRDRACCS